MSYQVRAERRSYFNAALSAAVEGIYTSVVVRHPVDDRGLLQFPDITFRVDDLF
jgi:hypothetical protein